LLGYACPPAECGTPLHHQLADPSKIPGGLNVKIYLIYATQLAETNIATATVMSAQFRVAITPAKAQAPPSAKFWRFILRPCSSS
jgi:hypothetical protein